MNTDNTPVIEVYQHNYQGITVGVQIDYVHKQISLVEVESNKGNQTIKVDGKQWLFKKRELEYMNGWRQILAAMESAIADAEAKLKAWVELEEKRKLELVVAVEEKLNEK